MADEGDTKDRPVTIDIETATETATRPEDVERIRREAGLEKGEPPSRMPGGESETDQVEHHEDHRIDHALQHRDGPQPG